MDPETLRTDVAATRQLRAARACRQPAEELYGFDVQMPEIDELNRRAYPIAATNGLEQLLSRSG
jgi:hypothetical protein